MLLSASINALVPVFISIFPSLERRFVCFGHLRFAHRHIQFINSVRVVDTFICAVIPRRFILCFKQVGRSFVT